jgi:cell division protein FtsL
LDLEGDVIPGNMDLIIVVVVVVVMIVIIIIIIKFEKNILQLKKNHIFDLKSQIKNYKNLSQTCLIIFLLIL